MLNSDLLFVYGTLRRDSGHAMGRWLAERAEWRGAAWCEAARLYRVDWYPALVPGRAGERVRGDLYRLAEPATLLWRELDAFEGVAGRDDDEYERRQGEVVLGDGKKVQAWSYWYQRSVEGLELLAGGDWLLPPR
jgi:gamma-glutamylcyclotransferase (GGCT)/AIG2-like uncharacterized protein YtfP